MLPFFMILPGTDRTQGFDCGFDPNGLWSCALTPGGQGGVHGSGPKSNQEAVLSQVQRSWFCKLFPIWTDTDGGLLSRDFNLPDLIRSLACTSAKPYTSLWPVRKMANESSEFSSTMQKEYRKYTYIYIHMKNRNQKFLRDGLARRSTKRSSLSCHMSLVSFKVLDKWIGPAKWTSRMKWRRAKCWWSLWPDLWHKIQEDSTGRPRSIWSDSHKSDLVLCWCHSDEFHGHHITKSTNYVSHLSGSCSLKE